MQCACKHRWMNWITQIIHKASTVHYLLLRQILAKALLHGNAEFSWQKSMWCFITNVHYLKQTPLLIIRRHYYFRPKQMKFESWCITTESLLLCNTIILYTQAQWFFKPTKLDPFLSGIRSERGDSSRWIKLINLRFRFKLNDNILISKRDGHMKFSKFLLLFI